MTSLRSALPSTLVWLYNVSEWGRDRESAQEEGAVGSPHPQARLRVGSDAAGNETQQLPVNSVVGVGRLLLTMV
jgi:hypothetical protein